MRRAFRQSILTTVVTLLVYALASAQVPKNKPVPNESTAIRIAEAALTRTRGKSWVEHNGPYHARLNKKVWIVSGTRPPGQTGGEVFISVDKNTGVTKEVDMQ